MMKTDLFGYFAADPLVRGKATLFRLRCRDEDNGTNKTIGVVAYGKTGQLIQDKCREGKFIVAFCKPDPYTQEVDGETKHRLRLVCKRVEFGPDARWAERKRGNDYVQMNIDDVDVEVETPVEEEE